MLAYIYKGELLCEDCGDAVRQEITVSAHDEFRALQHRDAATDAEALGFDSEDETDFDSDDYPKGPMRAGESDHPDHCGKCQKFLENPLTADGVEYVLGELAGSWVYGGTPPHLARWMEWYGNGSSFDLLRDVAVNRYRLRTFDLYRRDSMGKWVLAYIFDRPDGRNLFFGCDFHCSPIDSVDSDRTLEAILGFLTLRPGDIDADYFEKYTPQQLEFARSADCELLQMWSHEDRDADKYPFIPWGSRVWIRVGDGGEYDDFDNPESAGEQIAYLATGRDESEIITSRSDWRIYKCMPGGGRQEYTGIEIEDAGFMGDNYVSVYWGDDKAQFVRAFDESDFDALIDAVRTADVD